MLYEDFVNITELKYSTTFSHWITTRLMRQRQEECVYMLLPDEFVFLSVRPPVCPSHADVLEKWLNMPPAN